MLRIPSLANMAKHLSEKRISEKEEKKSVIDYIYLGRALSSERL
jgi:hypothetical protein